MPIIKSAKKRVRVSNKAAVRNSKTKRSLRSALKGFSKTSSAKSLSHVQSEVDKATKKGVVHKNKAARLKSRAAKQAKASGVKTTKKATPKKPVAKKTTKKTTTKKK
ncbi:MAG TPA: 30S ribosomal protein S20 [Candidatus Saccharimonadales bacterium]|nr:30S ribosomal protein S20 [Candidatus Saccharimonadales bacterium]